MALDGGGHVVVLARHAIHGAEVRVRLPARAKFKHVKRALAKFLGNDEMLRRGQLMSKQSGTYSAYKDGQPIGDVREVLVVCAELAAGLGAEAALSDGELSPAEEAPERRPAQPRPGGLTREQAIGLQQELLVGFAGDGFQGSLEELQRRQQSGLVSPADFVRERQALFLTVQGPILPTYGFEASREGVFKMMAAMGEWTKDPEFIQLASDINDLIGIESPAGTWSAVVSACERAGGAPRQGAAPKRGAGRGAARPPRGAQPQLGARLGAGFGLGSGLGAPGGLSSRLFSGSLPLGVPGLGPPPAGGSGGGALAD